MAEGFKIADAYVEVGTKDNTKDGLSKIDSSLKSGMTKSGEDAGDASGKASGGRFASAMHSPIAAIGGVMAGAFAVDKVVSFFGSAITEARESQKVNAQTEAVIKSTGGAAKVSAGQMGDYATAISNKTGIDDEQIQAGENMLATFTNVRNEVGKGNDIFKQATMVSTDMAVATGTDQVKANVLLGKALNDPIKGVGALTKIGVTFTDGQKKSIKAMAEHGDMAGAQKIILAELSKEFGGSAAAQSTAGEKAANSWNNLKESIGTGFLPIIDKVMGFISNTLIPGLIKMGSFLADNGKTIGIVAGIISAVFLPLLIKMGVESTISAAKQVAAWVSSSAGAASSAVASVASMVVQGAKWVWMGITALAGAAQIAAAWLISLGPIAIVIAVVVALGVLIFNNMDLIKGWISAAWNWIKGITETVWNAISGFFSTVWNAIKTVFTVVLEGIRVYVETVFNIYKTIITTVFDAIKTVITVVWDAIKLVFTTVLDWIKTYIETVFNIYKTIITTVINAIQVIWTTVWNAIKTVGEAIWNGLKTFITTIFNAYKTIITDVINAIKSVWDTVWNAIKSIAETIWNAIKATITTVINAISSTISTVLNAIKAVWTSIWNGLSLVATSVWNGIKSGVQAGIDKISAIFTVVKSTITEIWSSLWNGLSGIVSGVWNTISGAVRSGINAVISGLNVLISGFNSLPSALRFGITASQIPMLAKGGVMSRGGAAIVGDAGPELLELPTGARVTPLNGSNSGGGGATYTGDISVTIPVKDLKEMKTVQDFFDSIQQQHRKGAGAGAAA